MLAESFWWMEQGRDLRGPLIYMCLKYYSENNSKYIHTLILTHIILPLENIGMLTGPLFMV